MAPVRSGLLPVAAGAWTVALVSAVLPDTAPALALTLWAAALLSLTTIALVRRTRAHPQGRLRRRTAILLLLALVCAAAVASHVAFAQPARERVAAFALEGGRSFVLEATVIGKIEQRGDGRLSFDARAERVVIGRTDSSVHVDVSIRVDSQDVAGRDALDLGAVVEVQGTARPPSAGKRAVLDVSARGVTVVSAPEGLLAWAAELRRGLIRSTAGLPEPGAGLIPGLAVGDTSTVSAQLDTAMKESSLSHLTAVSGANCAIVVGLAFGAVALLGGSRRARVIGGLGALGGFVVLVTPEPSVVRAGAMATIAMVGLLLGRTGAGTSLLSLAVTALLIADPWLSASLGFALSAVATGSLLLFARPLAAGLGRWMPRAVALALSVPLAAQLACGPLLVLITPEVPVYGVVANLLAAPAAPIATVVGLAACLSAPLAWVQAGLAAIAWLPASWIAVTAHVVSDLPAAQAPWLEGWAGAAGLAVVGAATGVVIIVPRTSGPPGRWLRAASLLLIATVVGGHAGGVALGTVAGRWTIPTEWSVLACDVGQGDAVLVRSGRSVALIDTGPAPEMLERCLSRAGIDRIDLLVLTHFDLDHAGGASAVIGRVAAVVHGPSGSPADEALLDALRAGGAHSALARTAMRGALGAATWRVLWPPDASRVFTSGNDASVVVEFDGGVLPHSVFLGDLSAAPQAALAASHGLLPPYDLVKIAHHGSADQHAPLYAMMRPTVGLITVGSDNTFGHPRVELLDVLETLDVTIARTDRDGMVAVWREDGALRVWREHAGGVGGPG